MPVEVLLPEEVGQLRELYEVRHRDRGGVEIIMVIDVS
jgi:hypothetical protein